MSCVAEGLDLVLAAPFYLKDKYQQQDTVVNVLESAEERASYASSTSKWLRLAAQVDYAEAMAFNDKIRQWVVANSFQPQTGI